MKNSNFWIISTICIFIINHLNQNVFTRILLGVSGVMLLVSVVKTVFDWRNDNA